MKPINGVFLDSATFGHEADLSSLQDLPVDWSVYSHTSLEQRLSRCQDAQLIVTNKVTLDAELLSKLSQLKLVCITATGMNNVDLNWAKNNGVSVKNVENYAGNSVAQLVFSLLLELMNKTNRYAQLVKQGQWSNSNSFCLLDYQISELTGKTLGLIGYGTLAKSVEKIARAFDMEILVAERKGAKEIREGRTDFYQVLKQADVFSIHCPLTPETTNLISQHELTLMKQSSVLINTARGGIVNEPALLQALQQKVIAGAATDVLTTEPPRPEHVLLTPQDNLIVTPHIAWASVEARARLLELVANNIKQHFGI